MRDKGLILVLWISQLLGSLGDLNQNIREGFNIIAACSDNWNIAMGAHLTNQEDRLTKLEYEFAAMNSFILMNQSLNSEIQEEYQRVSSVIRKHEDIIPKLNLEVQATSLKINSVEHSVKQKIQELDRSMKKIREFDLNSVIPPDIIDTLNSVIMDVAPATILEYQA